MEGRSKRAIHRLTGAHRDTITRALAGDRPPTSQRRTAVASKLDPYREWICEQLELDPRLPSQRLRELAEEVGYGVARRSSTTTCARCAPGFWLGGRFSARCIGRASWCSATFGSRASRSRSGMGSCAEAGW